jgi:putative membrane protein
MDSEQESAIQELRDLDGERFAARYVELQVRTHDGALRLFERCAAESADPDLARFAKETLPALRKHREHLDSLASN